MAGKLGKYAYFSAFLIFVTQCLFFTLKVMISSDSQLLEIDTLVKILDFFTTAVAIVIVAVPEGLPLAISLSIAFSLDAMKDDNILIKNNDAFETMGMIDSLCTGKTSTLTNNKMNVQVYYTCGKFLDRIEIDAENRKLDVFEKVSEHRRPSWKLG